MLTQIQYNLKNQKIMFKAKIELSFIANLLCSYLKKITEELDFS